MDNSLQNWLNGIKLSDLPILKKKKKTIMDIAGIDHLETKWSSIYAYFFNPKEAHGLGTLFYDSLLDIVLQKKPEKRIQMDCFTVETEFPATEKEGNTKFIDILIKDGEHAIIIENKVHASLYNPLSTYWESVNVEDDKKCGVVLSLYNINTEKRNHNFINITHERFMKQIEKNLYKHYRVADPKSLLFLQDFIQNIYNQKNIMDKELLDFYYKGNNHLKINQLSAIRNSIIEDLSEQIEDDNINTLLNQYELNLELKKKKNHRFTYYAFTKCNKAMITLIYDKLWLYENNGCRIQAILEFQGDIMKWIEKNHTQLSIEPNPELTKQKDYWHYYSEDLIFESPATELSEGFQQNICEKLKKSIVYKIGCEAVSLFCGK